MRRGSRAIVTIAVLLGVVLAPLTLAITQQERSRVATDLDQSLAAAAQEHESALANYLERARSIILLMVNNPSFAAYYGSDAKESAAAKGPALEHMNEALVFLNTLYPDSIGEACVIDRSGAEVARAVRGEPAQLTDLSPDESGNPFFGPSFRLQSGDVYHSEPYVSPDTGEWVIANATPIPVSSGRAVAVLHFEVTIESFRRAARELDPELNMRVVESRTGRVVIDNHTPQHIGAPLGGGLDHSHGSIAKTGAGTLDVGATRVAYRHLRRYPGDANRWYVVASSPKIGGLLSRVGLAQILLLGLAALLVLGGASSYVMTRRADKERVVRLEDELEQGRQVETTLRNALKREHEAADRLRTLDEMRTGFLRAISHELRTPLTAVLGYAHILQESEVDSTVASRAERDDMLGRLVRNADKLHELLTDLLDLDRLERGIIAPQLKLTNVGALVRRTMEATDTRGRIVHCDLRTAIATVDIPKVERIVENLVNNAIKHTRDDTTIWVSVEDTANGALIKVEDDGPGIPEGVKAMIFNPFVQGPSCSPHAQGTGIGLSLVVQFVELHGGHVWVEDRAAGGASFRVLLPHGDVIGEAAVQSA